MANPQPDKFTKVSTEILENLCKIRISGEAMQVLLSIISKTWRYQKKEDWISLSQFSEMTGMSKVHVCRAINKLISMNIITKKGNSFTQKGNAWGATYSIQKDYDKWKPLPKKVTLPKKVIGVTQKGKEPLPKKVPTIDNYTKDNITIESSCPKLKYSDDDISIALFLNNEIFRNNPNHKEIKHTQRQNWANEVRLMREVDKRSSADIRKYITWTQNDNFWRGNILSMSKLRKQWDQLTLRMTEKPKTTHKIDDKERIRKKYEKLDK